MMETKDAVTGPREEGKNIPGVKRRGERLIGLLLAGVVLLNFPLMSVFNVNMPVFGIPALFLYLLTVWVLIIGVMALVLRERPADAGAPKPENEE